MLGDESNVRPGGFDVNNNNNNNKQFIARQQTRAITGIASPTETEREGRRRGGGRKKKREKTENKRSIPYLNLKTFLFCFSSYKNSLPGSKLQLPAWPYILSMPITNAHDSYLPPSREWT